MGNIRVNVSTFISSRLCGERRPGLADMFNIGTFLDQPGRSSSAVDSTATRPEEVLGEQLCVGGGRRRCINLDKAEG